MLSKENMTNFSGIRYEVVKNYYYKGNNMLNVSLIFIFTGSYINLLWPAEHNGHAEELAVFFKLFRNGGEIL
jgi:hypothetical protein